MELTNRQNLRITKDFLDEINGKSIEKEFQEKQEFKRVELMYYKLPNLIHEILQIDLVPTMANEQFLNMDIEEIKKITNAECESALSYFKKLTKT